MENKQARVILNRATFRHAVRASREPLLMEIRADWCGSCHIMAPVLEKLAAEYHGRIKFGQINIETREQVAREFGVTDLPILLFFRQGRLMDYIIGAAPRAVIVEKLEVLLQP